MVLFPKKICSLGAILLCGLAGYSQALVTYGTNTISKEEFLRAYNKNKPATTDREKSVRDYLELYTDFKLKVKAAEMIRLDTASQIQYDIQNFRDQIKENYLSNENDMQLLIDEAATRSARDLHVIYFSVPVLPNAVPADTMKAYNAAKELYTSLKSGNTDYEKTVAAVSAAHYPAKYSDIGYITAFTVNYNFENVIYNTKVGDVSEPFRSARGWNLFKVVSARPATGKWKIGQILFAFPPAADLNTKLAIKQKADSVYGLLQKGFSFAEGAKQYSDDRLTAQSGGEMAEFGSGKYNSIFENNVFVLEKDNEYTKPFESSLGYHIVKRISRTTVPEDKKDPAYQFEIKQKVMQDMRINSEKEKFAKEIVAKTGFKRTSVPDAELRRYADTLMKDPSVENTNALPISKKTIIIFRDGTTVKGNEWLRFVRDYNSNPEQKKISNKLLADKFFAAAASEYYKKHLEVYNNDFKYQMKEFKEGNMLFEIMERNVWSKAGADSAGLISHYNSNKENYKWTESADVIIFNSPDEKTAEEIKASLVSGKSWTTVAESSEGKIQADSARYEISQLPPTAGNMPVAGNFSSTIKNADGTVMFLKFIKTYPANMQRSFSEARGLVINDYQNVLERRWVGALRNQYPVKVNEAVFKGMIAENR